MNHNPNENPMLTAALRIAAKGIPVFPCHPTDPPGTPKNKRRAKRPLIPGGFKKATTDPEQITRWWTDWPLAFIGMPTGKASGIVVLDIDNKDGRDGFATLAKLEAKHGKLPDTMTITTVSGGEHRYFKWTEATDIASTIDQLGDGLDTRGHGGYVIVPPSEGYTVKLRHPLVEPPAWIVEQTRKPAPSTKPRKRPANLTYNHAQYLAALQAIAPTENEAEWFQTLCAAEDAGLTEAECRQWAKGSPDQYSDGKFTAHWNSITTAAAMGDQAKTTAGTLIHKARAAGWDDPYYISMEQFKQRFPEIFKEEKPK